MHGRKPICVAARSNITAGLVTTATRDLNSSFSRIKFPAFFFLVLTNTIIMGDGSKKGKGKLIFKGDKEHK